MLLATCAEDFTYYSVVCTLRQNELKELTCSRDAATSLVSFTSYHAHLINSPLT